MESPQLTPTGPSVHLKLLLASIALGALIVVVHYPGLDAPFFFDDFTSIVTNGDIRGLSFDTLLKLVRGHRDVRAVDHHPVSAFTFLLDYQWAGLDPFGFHLSNLFYLWLACAAALLLSREIFAAAGVPDAFLLAVALCAVWVVHPFATMQSGYVTGRQEALLILFYLLSLYCFLKEWLLPCLLCGIASFLCKEVAVTLPGAILLLDWARGNRNIWVTHRVRRLFYAFLTTIWLALCYYHLRGGRTHEIGTGGMPLGAPWEYCKAQCGVWIVYVRKMFWPAQLQFFPYIRRAESWLSCLPGLLGLLAYLTLTMASLRYSRWLFFTLAFPVLVLTVTSSFIPIPFEPAMEYRMFLPSLALWGLLLLLLWRWARWPSLRWGLVALLIVALGVRSNLRLRDYVQPVTLYEKDFIQDPDGITTLEALAHIYRNEKLFDRSIARSERMLDLSLRDGIKEYAGRALHLIGLAHHEQHHLDEAQHFFERSIAMSGRAEAKLALASILVERLELKRAEKLLNEFLLRSPDNPDAIVLLFEWNMSSGRVDQAEEVYHRFRRLYPERHDLDQQPLRMDELRRRR